MIKLSFNNSYEDDTRAKEYATLDFDNTYHLAFRDLPEILKNHTKGTRAIDFGCGTGRSTRFLQQQGYITTGIDISKEMIIIAQQTDPEGDYQLVLDGDYTDLPQYHYDVLLSAFTFDNIPMGQKNQLFSGLINLLNENGIFINLVSSPEMYTHEWASFSTKNYPENKHAKTGDEVPIITTDFADLRPCIDIFCTDEDYKKIYNTVGLQIIDTKRPLATGKETYQWVNETHIPPWTIYVLRKY